MSEHDFHPVYEGCMVCAALPGEDIECLTTEEKATNKLEYKMEGLDFA